jgi:hypothetical protein
MAEAFRLHESTYTSACIAITRHFCHLDRARFIFTSDMPPTRRIEDHIRVLCARVSSAQERDLVKVLCELQSTIHEYTRRSENKISASVLSWRTFPRERRKA